ncbi:MAG: prolipoprotein diacylglyceryl transferase [Candidatus Omnitrophota bacterium]|nr:prolipoprotein diacylglyceryl transferase [Candidatus Omnitrophota bacterium]
MHPILFEWGPVRFYSYGLLIAVGFLAASALAARRAVTAGLDPDRIQGVALTALIAGLAGGRIAYVLLHWDLFRNNPLEIFRLDHGGLVFFGGLAAGLLGGVWAIRRAGLPVVRTVDLLMPPVALAHALGRVGCFLNGCCYGKFTVLPWGVRFPGEELSRHPTQLVEALALGAIFFFLKRLERREPPPGTVLLAYGLSYGLWRFCIEFLRADNPPIALGLTVFQWISLGIVAVSALVLAGRRRAARGG